MKQNGLPTICIVLILLGAAALRVWNFDAWPPGLSSDEARNAVDAFHLARFGVLPPLDDRPEMLFRLVQTLTVSLIGPTRFGFRVASFFTAVLTVAAAYRAGRHALPRGSEGRLWAGLLTAGLLAIMVGHAHLSRVGYRGILLPLGMLLFTDAFITAWEGKRLRDAALAGVWLGVCAQAYTAGLIMLPLAAVALGVAWVLHRPDARHMLTFAGASVVALLPTLLIALAHPDPYSRTGDVGSGAAPVLGRIGASIGAIVVRGDINPQYNVWQVPLLHNRLLVALLIVGIVACVLHPKRLFSWVVLGMAILALLPAALSQEAHHGLRLVGEYAALPLVSTAALMLIARVRWQTAAGGALALLVLGSGLQGAILMQHTYSADLRWGEGGVISAWASFFETRSLAVAEAAVSEGAPVYLPLAEASAPFTHYFLAQHFPHVETAPSLDALPPGRVFLPARHAGAHTFVLLQPETGTIVLLPRFDEGTLIELRRLANNAGRPIVDAFGEEAGVILPDPTGGTGVPLPQALDQTAINYGSAATLRGWDGPLVLPDEGDLSLTFYLVPGEARPAHVSFFAQLWDVDINRLSSSSEAEVLPWLYPAARWQPDDVIPVIRTMEVPPDLSGGAYLIAAGMFDGQRERLPVLGPSGEPVDTVAVAGTVKVPLPEPELPAGLTEVGATFNGEITLIGYIVEGGEVVLAWQAQQRPRADYNVLLHVVDEGGQIVAQGDGPPVGGRYPTGVWSAGEVVITRHPVAIPEGPVTLYAGLYT
ncbi:MAG: hypothetical protein ACFB51_10845 [Anaerolineae bacterium]